MILLDASYINTSGGKVLLELLIKKLFHDGIIGNYFFIFDDRMDENVYSQVHIKKFLKIKASIASRKHVFKEIIDNYNIHSVLCFNNIPPPFFLKDQNIYIYFHNILFLEPYSGNYSLFRRTLFRLKWFYIKYINKPHYHWIVQTDHIRRKLEHRIENVIHVLPIYEDSLPLKSVDQDNSFLYVADGSPQKNHILLIDTWELLALKYNLFPALTFTVNEDLFPDLMVKIKRLNSIGCLVQNTGILDKTRLNELYLRCKYFIFPSKNESFGLPLIEAAQSGCYILAADLPYIYDVITPSICFDSENISELAQIINNIFQNGMQLELPKIQAKNKLQILIDLLNK